MGIITELTMRLASVEREPEKPFSAQRPLAVVLSIQKLQCPTESGGASQAAADALFGLLAHM